MLNKVQLIGRVGKDPEVRKCQNGSDLMTFSLATSEAFKDKNGEYKDVTEWHNIKLFKATSYHINNIAKGRLLYVEGKIQSETYQNKQGQTNTAYNILAYTVKILDKDSNLTSLPKNKMASQFQELHSDDIPF